MVNRAQAVQQLCEQAQNLPESDRLLLIENLIHTIRSSRGGMSKKNVTWAEINGTGTGLMNGEDAQEWVRKIRDDRK